MWQSIERAGAEERANEDALFMGKNRLVTGIFPVFQ